jgi:hypothetical protein
MAVVATLSDFTGPSAGAVRKLFGSDRVTTITPSLRLQIWTETKLIRVHAFFMSGDPF